MHASLANRISDTYNLTDVARRGNFAAAAAPISDAVGAVMVAFTATLRAAVGFNVGNDGQRLGRMRALLTFLDTDVAAGGDADARALYLSRINAMFRRTWVDLSDRSVRNLPQGSLREVVTELDNTREGYAPSFAAFCTQIPDPIPRVIALREAVIQAGGAATSVYMTIGFFHQHQLPFNLLREANVIALDRARRSAPANSAFPGFPQWGVGNAADRRAETNVTNHFLKHVLDADPMGHALAWKGELTHWWRELGITLRRRDARAWLGLDGFPRVEALFSAGSSAAGDDTPLPMGEVQTFLATLLAFGIMTPRFKDEMQARYLNAYRDRALAAGRAMTDKMVHATLADANSVFVSGADGDIFVVGRFQGPVLGISSCYFAQDRAAKLRDRVQMWALN